MNIEFETDKMWENLFVHIIDISEDPMIDAAILFLNQIVRQLNLHLMQQLTFNHMTFLPACPDACLPSRPFTQPPTISDTSTIFGCCNTIFIEKWCM